MKIMCADFETYYAPDYTLSKMTTESYIRDPRFKAHGAGIKINNGPSRWVPGRLLPKFFSSFDWSEYAMLGHNLHFDGSILNWHYGVTPARYIDTLGMSRAMLGQHNARHGLAYVAPPLINQYKMEGLAQTMGCRELSPKQEEELIDYCIGAPRWNPATNRMEAGDTELTWGIFCKMAPHFPKAEYNVLDWVTRQFAQPRLNLDTMGLTDYLSEVRERKQVVLEDVWYRNERGGFKYFKHDESSSVLRIYENEPVDPLCEEISRDDYIELRNRDYSADRITSEQQEALRKVLASAPQYAAALEALGAIPPTKINAKGKVTFAFAKTDAAHKELLEHENPEVQALVAARLEVKSTIEETRAVKYLEASTRGLWPVDYNYAGAKNTHRLSGGKGGGGNPTNLKRGGTLRNCIYASEGKTLLVADLAQIECRMVLWLGSHMSRADGGEIEALRIMSENGDLYSHFASLMYGWAVNKKEHPLERQIAKSAVLGLGFGMGPGRFYDYCKESGIPIEPVLAESAVALYRNTYAGVKQLWSVVDRAMKKAANADEGTDVSELLEVPNIQLCRDPFFNHVSIRSPSGLLLKYPDLSWDAEGEGTYRDGASRVKVFGGKFVENIVQHLARNILITMLLRIDPTYPVVMSTYDELVMEIDDNEETIKEATAFVTEVMTETPPEFEGLPLGVETGVAHRYGEAKK